MAKASGGTRTVSSSNMTASVLREPKAKASQVVTNWLSEGAQFPQGKQYDDIYDAIEHWKEGQVENKLLIELAENSEFKGALYRGITVSGDAYRKLIDGIINKNKDATNAVNQSKKIISWSADEKVVRDWYAPSAGEQLRIVFQVDGPVRGYNLDKGAYENKDKEVILSNHTKLQYLSRSQKYDDQGPYILIKLKSKDKKS